jgi:putative SOS response-associated peptidase YedK
MSPLSSGAAFAAAEKAMCGRYTHLLTWPQIVHLYGLTSGEGGGGDDGGGPPPPEPEGHEPSYNVAPGQMVLIIGRGGRGREARMMRWGFIPSWTKEPWQRPSKARADTVATAKLFRNAFQMRRCLVPSSGFYEWQKQPGGKKQPYWIGMKDESPFSFAGIWEAWTDPKTGEIIETFCVITTEPNEVTAPIHDRMPVVIAPADYDAWLTVEANKAQDLLRPYPAELMKAHPVSTKVNSPRNSSPDLIEPMEPDGDLFG